MRRWILLPVIAIIAIAAATCAGDRDPQGDNATTEAWQQVAALSQQRVALIGPYLAAARNRAGDAPEISRLQSAYRNALGKLPVTLPDNQVTVATFMEQHSELTDALARLVATPELYPQLMRDSRFKRLHNRIDENETMLNSALARYNSTVHAHTIHNRNPVRQVADIVFSHRQTQGLALISERERVQIVPPPQIGRRISTSAASPAPSLCNVVLE
ncbi:MAG: hypothetical protein GJT30_13285 [Geobacter sp.]|nr:hypothetical protein [Geobacter sp.]